MFRTLFMPNPTDFEAFLGTLNSQKFRALRPAQAHVLEQYNLALAGHDVGIELPTGAGKTLIALLIAEHFLPCMAFPTPCPSALPTFRTGPGTRVVSQYSRPSIRVSATKG